MADRSRDRGSLAPASGAVAGAGSVVAFTIVHHLTISNIWEMAPIMIVAGAVSGSLLVWVYGRMTPDPSVRHWLGFSAVFIAMYAVLPVVSMILYEPVMTFAEAVNLDGPPGDLIADALPLTIGVTIAMSAVVTALYGQWRDFGAVLLATTVLMLFLGLNLTIVGFVEFTGSEYRIIAGFLGLVVLLGAVFAAAVMVIERRALR